MCPRPRTTVAAAASNDVALSDGISTGNDEPVSVSSSRPPVLVSGQDSQLLTNTKDEPATTPQSKPIPVPRPRTTVATAASRDAALSDGISTGNDEPVSVSSARPVPVPRPRTTLATAATADTSRSDGACDTDDLAHTTSAWSEQRTEARKRAHTATLKSVERMSTAYNSSKKRRVQTFGVGDNVSVAIPVLDRTSTDIRRLPGQVTAVKGNKVQMYEVATEYGLLQTKLRADDLQSYSGSVDFNTTRYNPNVTLPYVDSTVCKRFALCYRSAVCLSVLSWYGFPALRERGTAPHPLF